MKFLSLTLFLAASVSFASAEHATIGEDGKSSFGWEVLDDVKLPKPLSDFSASVADGVAYIVGGCDDPDGNVYVDLGEDSFFGCNSASSVAYSFDVDRGIFTTLTELPKPRYRHTSAVANNKLFVVGGRTIPEDEIIADVDVYDFDTASWTTYSDLPEMYQFSDHASFTKDDKIYVVGGYSADYTAQDTMFVIDAVASTSTTWSITEAGKLGTARGDIHAAISTDQTRAFVSGGFTHADNFCAPFASTEQYNFDTDTWTSLPDLRNARGEVVLVELDNHLYAMGGERQIDGVCEPGVKDGTDPGELTVGTDEVEALENGGSDWKIVSGFPNHKFRFAAVGYEDLGQVYAFGGQVAYANDCDCFRTTDEVARWGEVGDSAASLSKTLSVMALGVAGWLFM